MLWDFFYNIKTESVSYIIMYNGIDILIYLKISNLLEYLIPEN